MMVDVAMATISSPFPVVPYQGVPQNDDVRLWRAVE